MKKTNEKLKWKYFLTFFYNIFFITENHSYIYKAKKHYNRLFKIFIFHLHNFSQCFSLKKQKTINIKYIKIQMYC